jgi:prepilin-type processing-associated H-X9-DG protein
LNGLDSKAGDAAGLPKPARHNMGNNFGFGDGHAKWAKAAFMSDFWKAHQDANPEIQK